MQNYVFFIIIMCECKLNNQKRRFSTNFFALLFKDPTPAPPLRGGEMRTAILVVFDTQTIFMKEQIGQPIL